jgi:hypothetical protein
MSSQKKPTKPRDPKPRLDKISGVPEKHEVEFDLSDEDLDKASGGHRAPSINSRNGAC